jgi:hypothetical protein
MEPNLNLLSDSKEWIEEISAKGVFEEKITGWIEEHNKNGSLTKEDVLKVAKKVALYRNDSSLVEEITQRVT